jgi:hypothetical protein
MELASQIGRHRTPAPPHIANSHGAGRVVMNHSNHSQLNCSEIGIARQTVVTAFSIVFGALMLAMAIAFGLGGRHLARRFLERLLGQGERKT